MVTAPPTRSSRRWRGPTSGSASSPAAAPTCSRGPSGSPTMPSTRPRSCSTTCAPVGSDGSPSDGRERATSGSTRATASTRRSSATSSSTRTASGGSSRRRSSTPPPTSGSSAPGATDTRDHRPDPRRGDHGPFALTLLANADPYTYLGTRPMHVHPDARFELGLDLLAIPAVGTAALLRILSRAFTEGGHVARGRRPLLARPRRLHPDGSTAPQPLMVDGDYAGEHRDGDLHGRARRAPRPRLTRSGGVPPGGAATCSRASGGPPRADGARAGALAAGCVHLQAEPLTARATAVTVPSPTFVKNFTSGTLLGAWRSGAARTPRAPGRADHPAGGQRAPL